MRYAAAGHPPLLWWRSSERRIVELEENRLLLGIMPAAQYSFQEKALDPGDRLLLYTDGLYEAANENGEFIGKERLCESLAAEETDAAESAAAALMNSVAAWAGHNRGRPREDDQTVIVIQVAIVN